MSQNWYANKVANTNDSLFIELVNQISFSSRKLQRVSVVNEGEREKKREK